MMRNLYIAIFLALAVMLVALLYGNWRMKRLAFYGLRDKAELYIGLQEQEMKKLSTELQVMRIREPERLLMMPDQATPQETDYYYLWNSLKGYNYSKGACASSALDI